jgi:hypothetical protein
MRWCKSGAGAVLDGVEMACVGGITGETTCVGGVTGTVAGVDAEESLVRGRAGAASRGTAILVAAEESWGGTESAPDGMHDAG